MTSCTNISTNVVVVVLISSLIRDLRVTARRQDFMGKESLLSFYKERTLDLHTENGSMTDGDDTKRAARKPEPDYRSVDYGKSTSRFMLELFSQLQTGDSLAEVAGHTSGSPAVLPADTVRCFSSKDIQGPDSRKARFEYQIPRLPVSERVVLAEFRFPRPEDNRRPRRLKLSMKRGKSEFRSSRIRVKSTLSKDDRFLVYDITRTLSPWVNGLHGNISLGMQISKSRTQHRITTENSHSEDSREGLLVIYSENKGFLEKMYSSYTEEGPGRARRSFRQLSLQRQRKQQYRESRRKWTPVRGRKRNRCQRYDFYVDFDTIGWGRWIVFPKRFNSYLCYGKCPSPVPAKLNPTNHAMMQSLMRQRQPKAAPMPCCVPTKLRPLSMLYIEQGEIVVRHHEDMIAEQCGCQ